MNDRRDEERLAADAKALFDDSVERLDAATLSRLNQGRQRALAELGATRPGARWARWVPATGVAAAAVVAVAVWQAGAPDRAAPASDSATDFEILLSEDSFEMLEDYEFYAWIDAAELGPNGDVG